VYQIADDNVNVCVFILGSFDLMLNRIAIFGPTDAGKITLAIQLASVLNLALYHLDKYSFVEKWIKRESAEFLKIQKIFVDQEQ